MTTGPEKRASDSGGGWSDDGGLDPDAPRGPDAPHAFRIAADARYRQLEMAGRGGMGEVVVARDRRLGRDVALKRIVAQRGDEALSRRLAREAWITARLEHPSIVPIYDAGVGDDGRLFYTMRLIHGRSLGEALAEARGLAERLGLLRHFLATCEAAAYAHSHGIVHRDSKPANIMVGGFGETLIVDWGLAGFASEATELVFEKELPDSAGLSAPAAKGTPTYMSPEQARGGRTDTRADVWALGAILHEIAAGERLVDEDDPAKTLARIKAGSVDRTRLHRSGAPAELCAIVDKATAIDPAARYRDAGDLAADVERYFDGHRVEAHAYTAVELVKRLVRQLRVPLIAAASALLAGSLALVISVRRISAERTRAVEAEYSARSALADNRETSAWALARQAVAELTGGAIAEAELLAAHALYQGESADARGVAAAAHANPHPARAETIVLPGCDRVIPGTWNLAVCHDGETIALWELDPPRMRWRRPMAARTALVVNLSDGTARIVVTGGGPEILVLDAATGEVEKRHAVEITTGFVDRIADVGDGDHIAATEGRIVTLISLRGGRIAGIERPCDAAPVAALAPVEGRVAIVCGDGRMAVWEGSTGRVVSTRSVPVPGLLQTTSAGLSRDGQGLILGGVNGEIVAFDLGEGGAPRPLRQVLDGPINRVDFLGADRRLVAIAGERGGVRVWDLEAGAEIMRLPIATGTGFRVDARGLLTGGLGVGRWEVEAAGPPRTTVLPAGLSEIAISPDGRLLAAARGDGRVSIVERASGRTLRDISLGAGVVKTVDFSPDGTRLAVSVSRGDASPLIFSVDTWSRLPFEEFRGSARRLIHDATGDLFGLLYAPPLLAWSPSGALREISAPEMYDAAAGPGRGEIYLLAVDGGIWRLRGGELVQVDSDPGARTIVAYPASGYIATGHDTGISVRRPGEAARWIPNSDARLMDLAVSPDDRYLAGARSDGTIAVWRATDLRLVATLRGHLQRVANLAFAPDGRLATAGWDGRILTWDLSVLETPPAELVRSAERAWGVALPLVLRSYAR